MAMKYSNTDIVQFCSWKRGLNKCLIILALFTIVAYGLYTQDINYETIQESQARYDFYQGINLLNSGFTAESLTAFQRAISIEDLPVYQYMYARANYSYGLLDAALNIYKLLQVNSFEQTFLQSKLEILQRTPLTSKTSNIANLVRSISIDLGHYGYTLPMNIRVLKNGDLTLAFLQSNDVIVLSPTGKIKLELTAGIIPILHPTDVLLSSKSVFLVPSFTNDDILQFSADGVTQGSFIKNKDVNGDRMPFMKHFSGPQFITEDEDNNIFVTTYGSARVFKFNSEGEYVLDFGEPTNQYIGLQNPTGIDILGDKIYVADYPTVNNSSYAVLYQFDKSGNYLDATTIPSSRIETIRKINDSQLLITSSNGVLIYENGKILDSLLQTDFKRLTSATLDKNNLLWVVDQGRNRLEAYTYLYNQYAGLDANILAIDTSQFPSITVKVKVDSISGNPLVGLDQDSFLLFENNVTVDRIQIFDLNKNNNLTENIILVPSPEALSDSLEKQNIQETLEYITGKGEELIINQSKEVNFWLLESAAIPKYLVAESSFSKLFSDALVKYKPSSDADKYLPLTLRYAINTLLLQDGAKKIVFLGTAPPALAQNSWQWEQIQNILELHRISFIWIENDGIVNIDSNIDLSTNHRYLQRVLNSERQIASKYAYFDTRAFDTIFDNREEGLYSIKFDSSLRQNFDKYFIPLNIEVNFFSQSGNDLSGYVMPGWEQ